ncbi:hypothetical protein OJ996_25890 [Luteolibacter sp. GHJ8]|uniref:Uncharacterized protein n=1 Tax=Luteolibacter rhizosphaerae TaxID=2989719 RepID=A0ABT3GB24_9BACT|nr:hypothetical protein [Luteolibacter rhizosphaerae]MCW1917048.1 hypothetical protein [Luteolibacter rhizosphaerae]
MPDADISPGEQEGPWIAVPVLLQDRTSSSASDRIEILWMLRVPVRGEDILLGMEQYRVQSVVHKTTGEPGPGGGRVAVPTVIAKFHEVLELGPDLSSLLPPEPPER